MNKVHFRNWVRRRFNLAIPCEERERVYLTEFPWLSGLVPLGWSLYPVLGNDLTVQKVDATLLSSPALQYGDTYIVSRDGHILTKVRKSWLPRPNGWETLYQALARLKSGSLEQARYVVVVNAGYISYRAAVLTVSKLPKTEVGEYIGKLHREAQATLKQEHWTTEAQRVKMQQLYLQEARDQFLAD